MNVYPGFSIVCEGAATVLFAFTFTEERAGVPPFTSNVTLKYFSSSIAGLSGVGGVIGS